MTARFDSLALAVYIRQRELKRDVLSQTHWLTRSICTHVACAHTQHSHANQGGAFSRFLSAQYVYGASECIRAGPAHHYPVVSEHITILCRRQGTYLLRIGWSHDRSTSWQEIDWDYTPESPVWSDFLCLCLIMITVCYVMCFCRTCVGCGRCINDATG